jgi:hypothetical protein
MLCSFPRNPSDSTKQWINDHMYRLIGYPFDDKEMTSPLLANPLVLPNRKDASGNFLYIPYACGGTCPQYAADISSPRWRSYWVSQVTAALNNANYVGISQLIIWLDILW